MLKVIKSLGLLAPNRHESDLSNEVLYILVGQEAAKISEVKVGGRKKSARSKMGRGSTVTLNALLSPLKYI